MDSLLDLPGKLASAILALFLILMALQGPKGPPSAPSAQLVFPFMYSSSQSKQTNAAAAARVRR